MEMEEHDQRDEFVFLFFLERYASDKGICKELKMLWIWYEKT